MRGQGTIQQSPVTIHQSPKANGANFWLLQWNSPSLKKTTQKYHHLGIVFKHKSLRMP